MAPFFFSPFFPTMLYDLLRVFPPLSLCSNFFFQFRDIFRALEFYLLSFLFLWDRKVSFPLSGNLLFLAIKNDRSPAFERKVPSESVAFFFFLKLFLSIASPLFILFCSSWPPLTIRQWMPFPLPSASCGSCSDGS